MKFNQRKYGKKFNFLGMGIILVFAGLILYSSELQIINHHIYDAEVNTNTIKQRKLPAPRGDIFDSHGILLATTEYQNDLYIISHNFDGDARTLCIGINDCGTLLSKIHKYPLSRVLVAKNIPDELAEYYKHINGLSIFRFAKRKYTETSTSHIIGYLGKINHSMLETNEDSLYANDDYVGQTGLENVYDHEVHGVNGTEQYIVMANGLELRSPNEFLAPEKIIIKPVAGNDLVLSIDNRIQLAIAAAMGIQKGAAVALDVRTGAVLAMYSSPSFDPKNIKDVFLSTDYPLINRAVRSYAPGSTFKLITALAALELGMIDIHTKLECRGTYYFGGRVWHCWKHNGHGKLDMRDAIKHSCDIYFYQLAQRVGLDNINKYARAIGVGEFTGIDLDIESAGKLPMSRQIPGILLNTVIGQGVIQVTPLQLANAYATIINGGQLHSPKLVNSSTSIIIRDNRFKKNTIDFLMDSLYAVVNEPGGTAYHSKSRTLEFSGKTGTAQTAGLDKKKIDNAWFVGYYPIIEPRIVVCAFVEAGGHGSAIVPIAFAAIEEYSKTHPPMSYE